MSKNLFYCAFLKLKIERERQKNRKMASENSQTKLSEPVDTSKNLENSQQHDLAESSNLLQVTPIEKAKKLWNCYSKRVTQLHGDLANAEMF